MANLYSMLQQIRNARLPRVAFACLAAVALLASAACKKEVVKGKGETPTSDMKWKGLDTGYDSTQKKES